MQARNHSWRQRVGSYVHTYAGSEATRVAEISQRKSGLFPGQKPDGCSSNCEKTQEGEQYSTPRVENAFKKTSQSCEILWGGGGGRGSIEVKTEKSPVASTVRRWVWWADTQRWPKGEETGAEKGSRQGACLAIGKEERQGQRAGDLKFGV